MGTETAQVWCQSAFGLISAHIIFIIFIFIIVTDFSLRRFCWMLKWTFAIIHSCRCALSADDFCTFLSQTWNGRNAFAFHWFSSLISNNNDEQQKRDEKENNLFGSLHTWKMLLFAKHFLFVWRRLESQTTIYFTCVIRGLSVDAVCRVGVDSSTGDEHTYRITKSILLHYNAFTIAVIRMACLRW